MWWRVVAGDDGPRMDDHFLDRQRPDRATGLVTPVPEPATVWLLASGLLLTAGLARRRRSA